VFFITNCLRVMIVITVSALGAYGNVLNVFLDMPGVYYKYALQRPLRALKT
jgi:hypothetical protein